MLSKITAGMLLLAIGLSALLFTSPDDLIYLCGPLVLMTTLLALTVTIMAMIGLGRHREDRRFYLLTALGGIVGTVIGGGLSMLSYFVFLLSNAHIH